MADFVRTGTDASGQRVGMTADGHIMPIPSAQFVKTGTDDKGNKVGMTEDGQIQIIQPAKPKTVRDVIREGALMAAADTPTWQKGLVSLGAGLTDVTQGIGQIARHGLEAFPGVPKGYAGAADYDKQVADDKKRRDIYEEVTPGASIGRAVGAALPTMLLPAGNLAQGAGAVVSKVAPSVGAKVAQSAIADAALMGATQGGIMATGDGETHLGNAAKGAVAAAGTVGALNLAGKAATPVIRAVANKINPAEVKGAGMVVNGELTADTVRALEKEGIDVPNLTASAKERLTKMAAEAVDGAPVTAKELARAARLESLPVPIQGTKGQLSKDFAQNQLEQSLVKSSSAGAPLREAFANQDEKMISNFDAFNGKTGANISNEGDMGRSVEAALKARIDKSNTNISNLYRAAEKQGETLQPVSTVSLKEYLREHDDPSQISYLTSKLKALGDPDTLTLSQLEGVRRAAVAAQKDGGTKGYYAGDLKKTIDGMTEGAGGEAYQAARAARLQHAMQFEEPGVIQNVVGMKSRTDRAVPFEDVFKKTVINGSIDDLKTLKSTLLKNDPETREAGVQAFKNMRGQAMQYLKDAATNNAHGDASEAALRRAYNQIGTEKMTELFGGSTTKQFENFLEAVKDLKVAPKGSYNPSGTAGELMNWVDRILSPFSITGRLERAAVAGAKMIGNLGKESGQVSDALNVSANREAANKAAALAQQNERVRALLDSSTARKIKRGAGAVGSAYATD